MKNLLLFVFFVFCSNVIYSQYSPTIATCDGKQVICASSFVQKICVKIIVDPSFGIVDSYTINWGDNSQIMKIQGTGNISPGQFEHSYNLANFYSTCEPNKAFTLKLLAYKSGDSTNNSFTFEFRNPPKADFSFLPSPNGCIGEPVDFKDESCLRDPNKPISWTFGDGGTASTSNITTSHTYPKSSTYVVKMKVESNWCGSDIATDSIKIVDRPVAKVTADSGAIPPTRDVLRNDTVTVCLKYNDGKINFNGDKSLNETKYQWTVIPATGWVLNMPRTINSTSKEFSVDFNAVGKYKVKLVAQNDACKKTDSLVFFAKVVDTVSLKLDHQPDVCDDLNYTPSPLVPGAKYKIDGVVVTTFPKILPPKATKYKIEAELSNECNRSIKKDSFSVIKKDGVKFVVPLQNAKLCLNSTDVKLEATPVGGVFTGGNVVQVNSTYFFQPKTTGQFSLSYKVGSGTCEQNGVLNIEVVKDILLELPPQEDVCNPLSFTPGKYNSAFTYKIDGVVVSTFPKSLAIKTTPYIVSAEYKGLCTTQLISDTFFVKNVPSSKILVPSKDTIVCMGTTAITLKPQQIGGTFSGTGITSGNSFTPSAEGVYSIKYTIGTKTCEQSSTVKITVVKDLVVTLPPQLDECTTLSYTPQNFNALIKYKINGQEQKTFPFTLNASPNPYIVTAEFSGVCGNQLVRDTFFVRSIPSPKVLVPSKDTIVCLNSTPIKLKPQQTGGTFSGNGIANGDTFTPSAIGDFAIKYTIGKRTCEQISTVNIKVVKDLVVTLPPQEDECTSLSYTPKNYDAQIKYKINGQEQKTFPFTLNASTNPYIVTAEFSGVCGNQLVRDTFFVRSIPSPKVLVPSKDTIVCLNSTPIKLKPQQTGGTFSGNGITNGDTFTPSAIGDFAIKYTIGKRTCEQISTVNIKVVKDLVVTLPPQEDECTSLSYTPKNYDAQIKYKINGQEQKTFPFTLNASTNPYIVTAEFSGVCGNQLVRDTFFVRSIPSPKVLVPSKDTVVCLNSAPIKLKPQQLGGAFSGMGITNGDIFTPSVIGDYSIKYTIGVRTCEQSSTVKIKVVKDLIVTLPPQLDECTTLSYTPKNYDAQIKYKINGQEQKTFPIALASSTTPYIVTAEFSGVCGDQLVRDTFFVKSIPSPKILVPSKDTVVCLDSAPIKLKPQQLGGTFSGMGITNGDIFTPSVIGDYSIKYTIGVRTCEQSSTVKIKVVKDLIVTLPPQLDECTTLSYTPQNFSALIKYKINGQEQKTFPIALASSTMPYIVTAEFSGVCGDQLARDTFFVRSVPSPKILVPSKDTVVCLDSSPIKLKPEQLGGIFSGTGITSGDFFTPDKLGDYLIKYTIGVRTCEQSSTVKITVAKDLVVTLPPQLDECTKLSYTPQNYNKQIKYKINGQEQTTFPVDLDSSPTPYIVTAEFSGVCGDQLVKDTFFVRTIPSPKTLVPSKDTIVCINSAPIRLKALETWGIFSGAGVTNGDTFTPDKLGEFPIKYTIGVRSCEQSSTLKITVAKDLVVTLPPQLDECVFLSYKPMEYNPAVTYKINGQESKTFPVTLDTSRAPYIVTAEYTGVCGKQLVADTFYVRSVPSAKILYPVRDTIVCVGSAPIILKTKDGGGTFSGPSMLKDSIFTPSETGDFIIKYTIGKRTCEQSSIVKIKVEKDLVVTLPPQADVCNPLVYSPEEFNKAIKYTINDSTYKAFPVTLPVSTKPYTVKASFTGVCGYQEKNDTFFVREPQKLEFVQPGKDTSICLTAIPLKITPNIGGGTWSGPTVDQTGVFLPTAVGDYLLTYSIGSGTCKVDKLLKINVQQATASVKPMVLCTYTPITQVVALPPGGKFFSTACPTCIDSSGLFDVKNIGDSTKIKVFYNYRNPLGCPGVFSADVEIEKPMADFTVAKACEGEPVTIDFSNTKAKTMEWFLDGKAVAFADINNLSFGPHNIKLVAKTPNCQSTAEKTLYVVNKPRLTKFGFVLSSLCSPADVTFNPTPTTQPNMSYLWDFGRAANDTLGQYQPPVIKYDTKTYTVSTLKINLKTYNECGSLSFDSSFQLKSLPLPRIQLDSSKIGCSPYEVTLTNRSLGEIDSCYWDFGNGKSYRKCENFVKTSFASPDSVKTFKPILYTYNICGVKSDTAEITVKPPGVRAFFNTDKYIVCPFDTILFKDASTPKPEKYGWFFGDGGVSSVANPYHIFNISDSSFKITLRAYGKCGYDTVSHILKTKKAPPVNFYIPEYSCEDKAIVVKNLSPTNLWKYRWSTSDGAVYSDKYDLEHTFKTGNRTETVALKVTSFEECTNELSKSIPVREKPLADFEVVSPQGCTPQRIHFINKSKNADSYIWYFGDSSVTKIENPYHDYIRNGTYDVKLVAIYDNNCVDSTLKINFVYIYDCNCYVPNIFTPNGDGVNDIFTVYGNDAIDKIESMDIYDRWGNKVFEGSEINAIGNGWDGYLRGALATEGVYTYRLKVRYKDGSTKALKGDVTLVY